MSDESHSTLLLQIKDKAVFKLADKLDKAERQLDEHPLASLLDLRSRLAELQFKRSLQEQAKVGVCLLLLYLFVIMDRIYGLLLPRSESHHLGVLFHKWPKRTSCRAEGQWFMIIRLALQGNSQRLKLLVIFMPLFSCLLKYLFYLTFNLLAPILINNFCSGC